MKKQSHPAEGNIPNIGQTARRALALVGVHRLQDLTKFTAGLFDEIEVGIVQVLLGGGLRFFDNLTLDTVELERTDILESPVRIDLRYRKVK